MIDEDGKIGDKMTLQELILEEENGSIFCKIGKSSNSICGKGGYFPYRDYIGEMIKLEKGSITFERLEDVVKFLHYGDDLVIFSFIDGRNVLKQDGCKNNPLNKGCYDIKEIFVKNVLSFSDVSTVDFIFNNVGNKEKFKEYSNLASSHLRDRGLCDSANRWLQLAKS